MKVYIASMFSDKDRVLQRAGELKAMGIECTSRWALEVASPNITLKDCTDAYLQQTAVDDIQDILRSDIVVLVTPEPLELINVTTAAAARGGRHFESGFMYGLIVAQTLLNIRAIPELILLGRRENVFHYLNGEGPAEGYPAIRVIETWEEVKTYLGSGGN